MKYFWCKLCKCGYDNPDALEYHLKKEHTKNDFISFLKLEAVQ